MGAGLAQVGMLLLLTLVGLPLCFFGLMAALDRLERALSKQPRTVALVAGRAAPAGEISIVDRSSPGAEVLALPVSPVSPLTAAAAVAQPGAAAGGAAAAV